MTGGESVQNVTLEPGMTAWACLAVATNAIVSNSDVVRAFVFIFPSDSAPQQRRKCPVVLRSSNGAGLASGSKPGHCQIQTRPLRVETGQYRPESASSLLRNQIRRAI
jgi:hypothetical protein